MCVISGKIDKQDNASIKWAHLHDGMSDKEPSFADLVPIEGWINDLQEDWRKANAKAPSRSVTRVTTFGAKMVWESSRANFQRGESARAFGAARYGLALAIQYPLQFRAEEGNDWAFACQCLVYLPYRTEPELLISLLNTLQNLADAREFIPACSKAGMLLALANFYQDGGAWPESIEIMSKIGEQGTFSNTFASVLRRDALARFFSGESRRMVDKLFEKSDELNRDEDFELSALIARAWILYHVDDSTGALDLLEPFDGRRFRNLEKASVSLSPHNIFELMLIRATIKKALGKRYQHEIECFEWLAQRKTGTQLRAVFTDHIAPNIIHNEFVPLYSSLRGNFRLSQELGQTLKSLCRKLIDKKESSAQGLNAWAD